MTAAEYSPAQHIVTVKNDTAEVEGAQWDKAEHRTEASPDDDRNGGAR